MQLVQNMLRTDCFIWWYANSKFELESIVFAVGILGPYKVKNTFHYWLPPSNSMSEEPSWPDLLNNITFERLNLGIPASIHVIEPWNNMYDLQFV